ncbi:MAG: hypothetical protein H8E62_05270 [Planctomycetes bacterium]|nr:hypothetical protein [Planctomycetota bacterium]
MLALRYLEKHRQFFPDSLSDPVVGGGHIDRPQFTPARAANRCHQIDGMARRFSDCGLAGRNRPRSNRSNAFLLQL